MLTVPVIDQSGRIFPVAGDTFRIAPGITIQIAAYSEVDIIAPDLGVFASVSGNEVYLTGVDNGHHIKVTNIVYS